MPKGIHTVDLVLSKRALVGLVSNPANNVKTAAPLRKNLI